MSRARQPHEGRDKSEVAWRLSLAVLAVVYFASAGRFVLGGDNGEFASIFALGGVPHPSGYPAYALYLRAMSWMPGVSAAHGAALATCVIGVGAVAAVRAACRSWGASPLSSSLTALVIGLSPLMWTMGTHAEVFALHALLAASILYVAGPECPLAFGRRAFLLGLLAGLGLSNNHSIVTVAPLGIFAAFRVVKDSESSKRSFALGIAGLVLGLSTYLHLLLTARGAPGVPLRWGETGELAGLWHHFLRADYGTTQLAISDDGASAFAHIARMALEIAVNLRYVPVLFALVGIRTMLAQSSARTSEKSASASGITFTPKRLHETTVKLEAVTAPGKRRSSKTPPLPPLYGGVWLATWLLAGPVFVGLFNLPLEGLATIIVERFYLLPMVLLCVPISRGIDRVVGERISAVEIYSPLTVAVLSLGVVVGLEPVREHHREDVERYLVNSLNTVTPGSVILGTGDHRVYGFHYVRHVLGVRSDVTYIDVLLLNYPWYRARIERELGVELAGVGGGSVNSVEMASALHQTGRSIYLTNRFSEAIVTQAPNYPVGTLIRIGPPPSPPDLEALNASVAAGYTYPESSPHDPDGWAAAVEAEYTRPWRVLEQYYESVGDTESAERCRSRGVVIPRSQ